MKNIIKISAIACAAALLFSLAGCTTKELDTAQYSDDAVTLASFGPNPVMRGGQLRFFGSNLQEIVEVNVPGLAPITEIEVVKSGKVSEIRVELPVEGPEVGIVSIKDKSGATYTTKSELTYTEPIVFDSFTANNPAYPGEVITINGDYMNLVQHVIFEGGEIAYLEEGATRHEVKVIIPATAVTGKIILSDGAEVENLLYSKEDLIIGQPTVTKIAKKSVKPEDEISFEGTHIEMFKTVEFRRMNEVVEGSLWIEDGKLHTEVPDVASDGLVMAVSYAGDKFEICEIECIMPSELVVENTPKAGDALIITGNDLDVITKVDLAGAENASFTLEDDGKLHVEVSETATDGNAKVFHPNGEFVEVAYTIVHPTITSVAPLELYAGDEPVIVTGTDLDLVAGAKIGTKDVEIAEQSETSLTLATEVTSVGGKVILTLANGETIESSEEVVMKYHSKVIVTSRPAGQHIGQEVVLKGTNMDLVESIFIGDTKVTKYGLRTPEEIRFLMPWCKVGSYELKFQLYDGDIETQADPIEVQLEIATKTIWEGEWACASWNGNQDLAWGGYDWSTANPGDVLTFEFELSGPETYHQMALRHGQDWGEFPVQAFFELTEGQTVQQYTLDAVTIADLVANGGLVITGTSYILHKVTISSEIPQERTIWSGSQKVSWNDDDPWLDVPGSKALSALAYGGFDWSQVSAGTTIFVHLRCIPEAGYSQIRYGNGNWTALPGTPDTKNLAADATVDSLVLTQEMIDELVSANGLVLCGHGYEITEVGLL